MAITLQPFAESTSFNFWLVCLGALYHFRIVGVAQTPSNRRNTPPLFDIPEENKVWCISIYVSTGGPSIIYTELREEVTISKFYN